MDAHSNAHVDIDSLSHQGSADTFTIPDAHLLFGGDYQRSGADLIVSDHNHRVVVPNYFRGDKHPTLVSPDGAPLDPKVIDALTGHVQYAQASGAAAAAKVVGHVIKMTGSTSVVRNGVTITLNQGDNVLQNDVVQTGSGSTLGLVMIDGTTFNLTAGARLMLNDLTYDATSTSNSSLFTLVQGAANFVAGQVAKTGDMKVGTPVATMGIRGTAVILDISAVDGKVSISVVDQRDGQVHSVQVYNTRGVLIGTVTSNGTGLTLTPVANFEVIAQETNKTPAQVAQEFNTFQILLQTYDAGKALFPSLPQHTDASPQSPTRYASSAGPTSPATEFHSPNPYIPAGAHSDVPGTVVPVILTSSSPTPTGSPAPTADPVVIPVQVVVPDTPLPFVVNPPPISRISTGGGDHFGPVMSADGQYIVYDPDGAIYLYDRQSNTTITIATPGDGFTYSGQTISADGHHVVFQGTDGTNSYIFIYNNDPSDSAHYQQTIQLVGGGAPAISGDGSIIVVEHGGNSIGIYNQQGHAITMITPAAINESGMVWRPAISADGHMIAFWSTDAATPGGSGRLFTYDLSTGITTEIASTATDAGTSAASFSADGRYVVYQSDTPDGHSEIYLYDLSTGEVIFHTENASGASYNPVISPDGHFIIFASDARLVPDGDTNSVTDFYVVDVTDPDHPSYTLVSNLANGSQPDAGSNLGGAISAGGLFIAFGSSASNLSQGDIPGTGDIFVVDATSGRSAIILESANSPDTLTANGVIALAGDHSGVTLSVEPPTSRFTALFNAQGDIEWHFSEPRSDFAALLPGQIATQNFVITLSTPSGSTTIPVRVSVYDADLPVVTAVANPGTIAGDNNANTLTGTAGNDILQGFGGDDTIIGLTGVDRAVYADATGGITADLAAGTVSGAGVGSDTLTGIEAIQGSNFADHYSAAGFAGSSGAAGVPTGFNSFEGMAGDDVITGNVNVQGQALTRISYASATAAVVVDFGLGTAIGNSSVGTDHFTNVNAVIGSNFGDTLLGSNNANGTYEQYEGRGGNDTIDGRGGYDMAVYNNDPATKSGITVNLASGDVTGDASVGHDTLRSVEAVRGTNFADTYIATGFGAPGQNPLTRNVGSLGTFNNFDGAGGNDTITGNGNTRIQYSNATAGVTVDFVLGTAIGDVSVGTDYFTGVNAVMGSMFVDHLSGSAGNENFMGLAGNDIIDGRGGFDVAQYNNMTYTTGGISVDFAQGIVTGDASNGTDTLRSIEGVQGTNFADSFDASGFGNSDHLNPALHNVGSLGTYNQFEGLGGDDQIIGNGNTRAVYLSAAAGVTVDLKVGTAHGTAAGDLANVGEDTFVGGVTGVVGSNFGDMLLGSENTAPGSIEQFDGRGGHDTIDGRGGFDQAIYSNDLNLAAGIDVEMAAGTVDGDASVGHDTLRSVESVIGTRFDDTYDASGFGISEHLDPATGNIGSFGTFNEFQGLGGDDVITGNGNTQLGYYSATAGVIVDLAVGTADGDASVGHDTFSCVNHIRASEFADTIYGDDNANTLEGMGGDDLLDGRGGNDNLIGGAGADTFVYTAGADTIDFNQAQGDRIDLTGIAGVYSLTDLNAFPDGPDIVINFGDGHTLTLSGAAGTSLTASDFIFAPAPNQPPVITGDTYAATEDTPLSITTLSISDSDAGNDPISVTISVKHGMLAFNSANGLTGDLDGSDGTVSLTGSQSAINAALENGVVYTPEPNYNGCSELIVTVNDLGHSGSGGARSATECFDISIAPVNDAPEFTGQGEATFVVGGPAVAVASAGVSVSDVDSDNYGGGTFTATVSGDISADELWIAEDQFISVVEIPSGFLVMYDSDGEGGEAAVAIGNLHNTGDLHTVSVSLNDNATDAAVQALAQAIQFENGKPSAQTGPRTVTFTLHDGGGTDNGGDDAGFFTATVNVTAPPNHAPVANDDTLAEPVASANSTLTIFASTLLENDSDPDSGDHPTFVSVSSTSAQGAHLTASGSIISYDPTHAAGLQALAAGETTTDTFTYTIDDGHGGTDTATVTVVVAGVNDAPDLTGHDLESIFVASGQAVALVDDVSVSDIDSADYAGGSLTATVTGNFHEGDFLSIANGDNIYVASGGHVMFDIDGTGDGEAAIDIGTLSSDGSSVTVTLNADAANAAVEALTEAIRFSSWDLTEDDRIVTIILNDGDGTADGGQDSSQIDATVHVTTTPPPNEPPAVIGDMSVVAVTGGGEVAITIVDLNAIDPDTGSAGLVFTVDHLDHGRLVFGDDRVPLCEGDTIKLQDIQAGRVFYQSVGTYVGQDTIALSLSDNAGGTATVMLGATVVNAQFTVLTAGGYNFAADDPLTAMGRGYVDSYVSESFTVTDAGSNREFIFTGSDFVFDRDNDAFTSGTITGILERDATTHEDIASFAVNVSAAAWYGAVYAQAHGDSAPLEALTGSWTFNFIGNAGADSFSTPHANDIFTGRAGNDTFDGNFGYDRAYYGGNAGPIVITLAAGFVYEYALNPTPVLISTDTLRSIELVTGSNYMDSFDATGFGSSGLNVGSEVTGNADGLFNEFEGRGGDDQIIGNGQTRISYYHATAGVTVTFTPDSWTSTSSGAAGEQTGNASVGNDHFVGVNSVRGSFFGDVFMGSTNPFGTAENFEGLGGGDAIDGGGGFDRAVYSREEAGLVFNMAAGTVLLASDNSDTGDTLRSIEGIWGTELADTYDATGFSPSSTNAGSAQFSATNSASTNFNEFEGGGGDDTVIGNGNTRVAYYHATAGVVVTLGADGSGTADGDASVGHDTFTNGVSRVRGSEFNDIITGDSVVNTLEGQGGNDVLDGQEGNDVLTGGTGADIFVYNGAGSDRISDFNRADGDRIDLRAFSAIDSVNDLVVSTGTVNGVANSTIITFGGVTLNLQGYDSVAHPLQAGDFIFAGQVAVTVQAPEGYDFGTLYDDLANSSFLNMPDRIYAVDADKGVSFELIGTGFSFDSETHRWTAGTITEINVLDTINPADPALRTQDHVLANTNGWNISAPALYDGIHAYANDVPAGLTALNGIFNAATYNIVGGGDASSSSTNVLFGGDHADTFRGAPSSFGFDTVDYSHATGPVTVNLLNGATGGAAAGDIFVSIDSLRGSDFNDNLTGDAGRNTLEGGLGNDTLDGGAGINAVSYQHIAPGAANLGVTVDLGIVGQQDTVGAGLDTLSNFQIVIGSAGNDTLTGDGNNNLLLGGAGADVLNGGGGIDGADYELAASGVIVNLANSGSNTGEAGGDTFISIENLSGSRFNDVLIGDGGNNQFWGFTGADTFVFDVTEGIGHDLINDFRPGQDQIQLDYFAFTPDDADSFNDWLSDHATAAAGNPNSVLIDFDLDGQNTVVLQNVSRASLHMNDFILPSPHFT